MTIGSSVERVTSQSLVAQQAETGLPIGNRVGGVETQQFELSDFLIRCTFKFFQLDAVIEGKDAYFRPVFVAIS